MAKAKNVFIRTIYLDPFSVDSVNRKNLLSCEISISILQVKKLVKEILATLVAKNPIILCTLAITWTCNYHSVSKNYDVIIGHYSVGNFNS